MATKTLAEINAIVRFRGDYQNKQKFSDTNVNAEIQTAFGKFYEIVDDESEGWWDTDATVTTVAAQAYIALPADCWRVKAVYIVRDGQPYPLPKVSPGTRHRYGSENGEPRAYRLTARGVDLYPTPDTAYTLSITYAPIAPTLSGAREWYNGWDDYVIAETLLALDTRERKPLGDRIKSRDDAQARLVAAASKRDSNGPELINLHEGYGVGIWDDEVYR